MPSVMLRREADGRLSLYIPKKDLEEIVESIEFDTPEKWGGVVELSDGQSFVIEPIPEPSLPITLRARRA